MTEENTNDLRKNRSALLDKLNQIMQDGALTTLEYSDGDLCITLEKKPADVIMAPASAAPSYMPSPAFAAAAPAPVSAAVEGAAAASSSNAAASDKNAIKSPMVGTAYLRPAPEQDTFVKVGDTVAQGQTLLIIEAMKVMNNLASPRAGTVKAILIDDAAPVEYDQPLIIIA